MLAFASRFAGAGISLTLSAESVSITTNKDLPSWLRVVAAVAAVVFLGLALALLVSGFDTYRRINNRQLSLVSHGTATVGGGNVYPPFPLLRLRFANKGMPGEFHAMAWWVEDGRRTDEWDVCWRNTSETTVFIETERVMNLVGLVSVVVGEDLSARPMRPAFPVGEMYTSQSQVGGDWRIEIDVWRVPRKKPLRSLWEVEEIHGAWQLSEVDEPLPKV